MRIKDIINEKHIKWLYETQKVVDNVDNLSNDIMNLIFEKYKKKEYVSYNAIQLYDGSIIKISRIDIKTSNYDASYVSRFDSLNIYATIYFPKTDDEIKQLEKNNLLNCSFTRSTGFPIYEFNISFISFNGKYNERELLFNITHELMHHFQTINNTRLKTDKDIKDYNKQYDNITNQAFFQNGILYYFSYICYYFTKSEISANVNGLYSELRNLNASYKNYREIYEKTQFYYTYQKVLSMFNTVKHASTDEWSKMRELAQSYGFYKETMSLNDTPHNETFKKHWINFINRMIAYTESNIQTVTNKALEDSKIKI